MAGLGQSMTSQKSIEAVDRARRALELRKAGVGFEQIAQQLEYKDASGAYRAVKRALDRTIHEPADELRALELARLDKMLMSHWGAIQKGHVRSTEIGLKIMERRASYLGLDAPKDSTFNLNLTDAVRIIGVNAEDI